MALPDLVRDLIPAGIPAITPGDIDTASRSSPNGAASWMPAVRSAKRATQELEKLATTQQQLDQRRSQEITGPLQTLATYLERWQDAIEQAVSILPHDQLRDRMPARPAAITAEAVSAMPQRWPRLNPRHAAAWHAQQPLPAGRPAPGWRNLTPQLPDCALASRELRPLPWPKENSCLILRPSTRS